LFVCLFVCLLFVCLCVVVVVVVHLRCCTFTFSERGI